MYNFRFVYIHETYAYKIFRMGFFFQKNTTHKTLIKTDI